MPSLPDSFDSANSTESSRHAYTSKQQPRLPGTAVILRREAVLRGPPYAIADSCGTPDPRPFRLASEREQSPELSVLITAAETYEQDRYCRISNAFTADYPTS